MLKYQGDLFAEDKEESSKNETQETAAVEDGKFLHLTLICFIYLSAW